MKHCLLLLLTLCLTGSLAGETPTLPQILKNLSAEKKKDRDTATRLLFRESSQHYQTHLPIITAAYRENNDPEARTRILSVLRTLYRIYEIEEAPAVFGFIVVSHLDPDGKKLSSLPIIEQVIPDSPAQKAGFLPGDIILKCGGKIYDSPDSRDKMVADLSILPLGSEVTFEVKTAPKANAPDQPAKIEKRIMKSTARSELTTLTRFTEKEFRTWLKELLKETT